MRTIVNEVFFIISLSTKNTNDKYVIRRGFFILTGLYFGGLIEREYTAGGGRWENGGDGSRLDSWTVIRLRGRGREGSEDLWDNR